jgi:hypothetical protein
VLHHIRQRLSDDRQQDVLDTLDGWRRCASDYQVGIDTGGAFQFCQ